MLVPAHNEAAQIGATIESLLAQTHTGTTIIVISDNSSDNTLEIAKSYASQYESVIALATVDNHDKKGGALNYGHRLLCATLSELPKFIMTMDADSVIDPNFIARAISVMKTDPKLGAVTGAVYGKRNVGQSLWQKALCWMQEIDYAHYAAARLTHQGIFTLSGAGALYRTSALNELAAANKGNAFKPGSRVEDLVSSLHLRQLGWHITSNEYCKMWTDVMPSVRQLVHQRTSWMLGSMRAISDEGWFCRPILVNVLRILLVPAVQLFWIAMLCYTIASLQSSNLELGWFSATIFVAVGIFNAGHILPSLGWKSALIYATNFAMLPYWLLMLHWTLRSFLKYSLTNERPAFE